MNKQQKNALALILDCLKGQKLLIILNCFLTSFVSVLFIALALLSKRLVDIATKEESGKFYLVVLFILLTVFLQLVLNALASHLSVLTSGKMAVYLRRRIFDTLYKKKQTEINKFHSGELLNRFVSDCDIAVNGANGILPAIFSTASKLIAGAAALLTLDWRFALGLITVGICIPAVARLISARYKKLHKAYSASNGEIKSYFQETLVNMPVIKSFASILPAKRKLDKTLLHNLSLKLKRNVLSVLISSSMYTFFTAGYFLVLIWGAVGISKEVVTYGSLIAFLQIVSQLRAPMQNISGIFVQYSSMMASAERLLELFELNDELLPLDTEMKDAAAQVFTGITAKELTFTYGENTILKNCNFHIKRGTITVITGESGKGKTTLFNLLLGYLDAESGSLTLDGKYDINASTRALFSYVPQGNMVLSGSILENLTFCNDKATKEQIDFAIKTAVLDEWVNGLPNGLNTKIGEHGLGISEGQAQRIAIARALLCNTPILLLDEATCSLDSKTETALLKNLKELPDKTVLLVTHRKVDDSIADCRLHLENKKFV